MTFSLLQAVPRPVSDGKEDILASKDQRRGTLTSSSVRGICQERNGHWLDRERARCCFVSKHFRRVLRSTERLWSEEACMPTYLSGGDGSFCFCGMNRAHSSRRTGLFRHISPCLANAISAHTDGSRLLDPPLVDLR